MLLYIPVHSCRADGFETIMMNCNPETVSTDYDTSSRLYFEPITVEDVLNVIEVERPEGIIVQVSLAEEGNRPNQHPCAPTRPIEPSLNLQHDGASCISSARGSACL